MSYRIPSFVTKLRYPRTVKGHLFWQAIFASIVIFVVISILQSPGRQSYSQVKLISPTNLELANKYLAGCTDEKCVMDAAKKLTYDYDPTKAITILREFDLVKNKDYDFGSSHLWAHLVGTEIVKKHGVSGKSFLMCPETFNYGCSHGFLEQASHNSVPLKNIVAKICGDVEKSFEFSTKRKFYCYHGAGHSIMQDLDYDLIRSLDVCDSLSGQMGPEGCWQGVFMEGNNAAAEGVAPQGVFSDKQHPLAPCDKVTIKYQNQCFINLPGQLIYTVDSDVAAASQACLGTTKDNIKTCLDGLGLVIANDRWQANKSRYNIGSLVDNTWKMCQLFPVDYIDRCIFGATAEIINMDQFDIGRALKFCKTVEDKYKSWCYESLGNHLRAQSPTEELVSRQCAQIPKRYTNACRSGAQL